MTMTTPWREDSDALIRQAFTPIVRAAGVTTVGRSQALKASAANTAEKTIAYFMRIPCNGLMNRTRRQPMPR